MTRRRSTQHHPRRRDLDIPPPPETERWPASLKACVVRAVRSRRLTVEEACQLYHLSVEELAAWERAYDQAGPKGLRVCCAQQFRWQPLEQPAHRGARRGYPGGVRPSQPPGW